MIAALLLALSIPAGPAVQADDVDLLALTPEIEQFVGSHVNLSAPPIERLEQLFGAVFKQDALHLVYDNSRTRTALETFQERRGNCLSFTTMFVAMARHAGLPMRFQEVYGIPTSFDKRGGLVLVNRHVNATVTLAGRRYMVDFNPQVIEWLEYSTRLISDQQALAQFYNNKGAEALARRDGQRALALFRKSLQTAPAAYTWANLGAAYSFLGDAEQAERSNLEALQIDRRESTAMLNLSQLYKRLQRFEEAEYYEKRIEKFRRKNPYYHYSLGRAAYREGRLAEAVRHFKDALKRKAGVGEFHFALARSYYELGELGKSRKSLKRARELAQDPHSRWRYNQKLDLLASLR